MSTPLVFQIGDKSIDSINVPDIALVQYYGYAVEARAIKGVPFETAVRRVRMLKQVEYKFGNTKVLLDDLDLLKMPIGAARTIVRLIDGQGGKAGAIIRDGDGLSTSIGYELGTPIKPAKGDAITELEFLANTYGDIEAVLSSYDPLEQTIQLLKTVAKPVHKSLAALPDWAINLITIADGVTIANKVLPRFLEDS